MATWSNTNQLPLRTRHRSPPLPLTLLQRSRSPAWEHAPGQGQQSIDLVGNPLAGTIEQSFFTERGRDYLFTGWFAQNPGVSEARANLYLNGEFVRFIRFQGDTTPADMQWDLDSVRLAEFPDASRAIALCDMRDLNACPGWQGQWGVLPFHATIRRGLYGSQLLTGKQVLSALDQCEAGKTPTGEGSKFAPRVATRRHNGGENYIFADGHAKWMRFRQTLNPEGGTEGSMWVQTLMRHTP